MGLFRFQYALLPLAQFLLASDLSAQSTPDTAFIVSRQAEVVQLGQAFYHTDLQASVWTPRQVDICPQFTHHVFVRYDATSKPETKMSYLAIYSRDVAPAKSSAKPWEGGVRLMQMDNARHAYPRDLRTEVAFFNRVWGDELKAAKTGSTVPGLTLTGLTACFARFAGELPKEDPSQKDTDELNLKTQRVRSISLTVQGGPKFNRWVYIEFDPRGGISAAEVGQSAVF